MLKILLAVTKVVSRSGGQCTFLLSRKLTKNFLEVVKLLTEEALKQCTNATRIIDKAADN